MDTRVRFFSQNGEDFLLWRFFRERHKGIFVDVGAFDGVHLSNTLTFEQQGWSGICVEPHPQYFGLCQKARPASICLNVACVGAEASTSVPFYTETLGLLSGLDPSRSKDVEARYRGRGLQFDGFKQIRVPAATLNSILRNHLTPGRTVDFISIDVEWTELEVLRGLDLERYRPRVLVIEASTPETRFSPTAYLLQSHGYFEARNLAQNRFYVREASDAVRLQSIVIDCLVEGNIHPLGKQYSPTPFIKIRRICHAKGNPLAFRIRRAGRRLLNWLDRHV